MAELTVRLQALDGTWETCGVDRYPGIMPESLTAGANEWGADTCSFTLRRDPGDVHPDLSAFTPCEIEVNGVVVWEGRVRETPSRDGDDPQINVAGQGWQYHLDDDLYERVYVHQRMSDWVDSRTILSADLTRAVAALTVNNDGGGIVLGAGRGVVWPQTKYAGITLDLRQWAAKPRRLIIEVERGPGTSLEQLYARVHNGDVVGSGTFQEASWNPVGFNSLPASPTVTTLATNFTADYDYLTIFVYGAMGDVTVTDDETVRIRAIRVFTDTAYESSNQSALKASSVVSDALDKATVLLSSDRSLVQTTSFNIPELALDGHRTPREAITAVNAYHRWRAKIASERRMMFAAQPSSPVIEAGNWAGFDFEDASANSGEEIYNRVIVEGTGADGAPLRVERWTPGDLDMNALTQVPNPSATVDASGWTQAGPSTLTRDTTRFASSPASFLITGLSTTSWNSAQITQPLIKGRRYRLQAAFFYTGGAANAQIAVEVFKQSSVGGTGSADIPCLYGTRAKVGVVGPLSPTNGRFGTLIVPPASTWITVSVDFVPALTIPDYYLSIVAFNFTNANNPGSIDSIQLGRITPTLADRRGLARTKVLPVSSALDTTAGNQIGDVFLASHRTTPLKGGGRVVGQGGIRRVSTGEPVHPSELLLMTTEILRLQHRLDPDTGAQGRDGILASVNYTHATEEASVQLDNERNSLESLLNRMAVITSAGR